MCFSMDNIIPRLVKLLKQCLLQLVMESAVDQQVEDELEALSDEGPWVLGPLCDDLLGELLHATWEVRHGVGMALREILRWHGKVAGIDAQMYTAPVEESKPTEPAAADTEGIDFDREADHFHRLFELAHIVAAWCIQMLDLSLFLFEENVITDKPLWYMLYFFNLR